METTLATCGLTAFRFGLPAPLFLCSSLPLGVPPAPRTHSWAGWRRGSASSGSLGQRGEARSE